MYTKPKDAASQIEDWRNVLLATKDDPSMIAYYAFHGARSDIITAKTYLSNIKEDRPNKELWIAELEGLLEIRRAKQ